MNITETRTNTIIEALQDKHNAEWCSHYGEPGYTDPDKGIIFADWNDIGERIQSYLESAGYELEWCDEWTIDYDNNKAYRTQPDSYDWVCQFKYNDSGEMLTPDTDIDEWLDELSLTDQAQPIRALPNWVKDTDLAEHGYVQYGEQLESGIREDYGYTDPQTVALEVFKIDNVDSVVFRIDSTEQFGLKYSAWYKLADCEVYA